MTNLQIFLNVVDHLSGLHQKKLEDQILKLKMFLVEEELKDLKITQDSHENHTIE